MYLRIINNEISYPYTIKDLKAAHRNITFPNELGDETMIEFGLYEVGQTPKPNDYTKNITEGTPVLTDGVYYQNWVETPATESEISYRIENKWTELIDYPKEYRVWYNHKLLRPQCLHFCNSFHIPNKKLVYLK